MFVVLDIDECGASSPVCDINANCSNTRGSYIPAGQDIQAMGKLAKVG